MSELFIVLEGLTEQVQQLADVIEEAFPGSIIWVQSEDETADIAIKIQGDEVPGRPLRKSQRIAA